MILIGIYLFIINLTEQDMLYETPIPCNSEWISELKDVTDVSINKKTPTKNQPQTTNTPPTFSKGKFLC